MTKALAKAIRKLLRNVKLTRRGIGVVSMEFLSDVQKAYEAEQKSHPAQGEDAEVEFGQVEPDDCDVQYPAQGEKHD